MRYPYRATFWGLGKHCRIRVRIQRSGHIGNSTRSDLLHCGNRIHRVRFRRIGCSETGQAGTDDACPRQCCCRLQHVRFLH